MAVALDIGAAVVFGGSRAQQRALLTVNVLGDVCEALIAAIYLDGGFEAAQRFVEDHWRERMLEAPVGGRNAKTTLQEWAQAQGHGTPTYEIAERSGPDHAPTFVITVKVGALPPGRGEGRNRREAEQAAATAVLLREGVWQTMPERARGRRRRDALRLRRADRRAQCRQVDAGQPAGRHQGLHRQPQGADDALDGARHRRWPGRSQIVFVDTPGIFKPKRRLDRAMVDTAWGGARDADIVALLIDAAQGHRRGGGGAAFAGSSDVRHPKVLLLNKIDTVKRESLLALADAANKAVTFERTFMISALTGDGLDDFMAYLADAVPPGPLLYPEDEVSDMPLRQLAAEITREKLFERLHQELPYHGDGRDRGVDRPEERFGARRADDLSSSATARRRSSSARPAPPSRRSRWRRARKSPRSPRSRCTSSSSSRCARTGPTTRNATAPWGSSSRRGRRCAGRTFCRGSPCHEIVQSYNGTKCGRHACYPHRGPARRRRTMRKLMLMLAPATLLAFSPVAANAGGTVTGAAGGAVTGAVVGGPVGAVVGGVIGAILGTAIDPPPPPVVAYVQTAEAPPPVVLQGNVVIGATLPASVPLYEIPPDVYVPADGHVYAYAIINGQRVVVDTRTHAIVAIVG